MRNDPMHARSQRIRAVQNGQRARHDQDERADAHGLYDTCVDRRKEAKEGNRVISFHKMEAGRVDFLNSGLRILHNVVLTGGDDPRQRRHQQHNAQQDDVAVRQFKRLFRLAKFVLHNTHLNSSVFCFCFLCCIGLSLIHASTSYYGFKDLQIRDVVCVYLKRIAV